MSAFHLVVSERTTEDEEMSKCKSSVHHVRKMEKDVDMALARGNLVLLECKINISAWTGYYVDNNLNYYELYTPQYLKTGGG